MKKLMRILLVVVFLGFAVFLYFYSHAINIAVLNPKGVIAIAEKNLLVTAFSLMLVVVIPIFFMLAFFLWRYRAGNTKAKYTPDWHTNLYLEATWWGIPTVIIVLLGIMTWTSSHELDPYRPIDSPIKPIVIQVVALDWKWLFIYPEEHIATVNMLEIPKGVPITLMITADAPMNGFWIPQLAGQVYAMPGMTAQLHLLANEQGNFEGVSSNFSGDGFSGMKFKARVVTPHDYEVWVKTVQSLPTSLTSFEYSDLAKPSKNNQSYYYGNIMDNLYTKVIGKFMPSTMPSNMEGMNMKH